MGRDRWDKRTAFIMASIGSAIGLGNVWRFPYMAYSNGGGAFFIPYIIALITTGIPLMALEYYLGIRYQQGPTEVFDNIKKRSNFIGWFGIFSSAMITIYYTVVMAWAINYMYHSIGVRWMGNENNFFFTTVLGGTKGIQHLGTIQWPIVCGNLITWGFIFFIISRGLKMIEKVIKWFVIIPWVLLLVLILRGITLPGALQGLEYYLSPNFSLLLKPQVWLGAYGQIFFSLSLGFGVMIAYASYMPKNADINTNAWIVSFANCLTSYFAGFAVFSALGYMTHTTGQPIDTFAGGGPGLAFVIYPTVIAKLPGGMAIQSIFGVLFFFMLFTLGIDSAFSLVEAIVTGIKDSFNIQYTRITFVICLLGFLAGFLYTTGSGLFWLDIVDHWMNWCLIIVGFLEAVLIGWFWDTNQINRDMDSSSEIKFGKFWVYAIKYVTPAALILIIISNTYQEFQHPYGTYPIWAIMLGGWALMTGLIFLSLLIQKRQEVFRMQDRYARLVGWLIIFVGMMISFYMLYTTESILSPLVMAVGSVIVGGCLIAALNRLKLPLSPK